MSDLATRLRELADWIETNAPDATSATVGEYGYRAVHVPDARLDLLSTGSIVGACSSNGPFRCGSAGKIHLIGPSHGFDAAVAK